MTNIAFVDRMNDELNELQTKIGSLVDFMGSAYYGELSIKEQDMLLDQSVAMKEYAEILGNRIAFYQTKEVA